MANSTTVYKTHLFQFFFRYLFARFRIVCPTNSVRNNDCYIKAVRKISSNIYMFESCVCVCERVCLSFGSDAMIQLLHFVSILKTAMMCKMYYTSEYSGSIIKINRFSDMERYVRFVRCFSGPYHVRKRFVLFISFLPRTKLLLSTRIIQSCYEDIPAMRALWICFHMFQVTPDYSFSTIIFFYNLACHIISLLAIGDGDGRLQSGLVWSFLVSKLLIHLWCLFGSVPWCIRQRQESSVRLWWHDMLGQSRFSIPTNIHNATVASKWPCVQMSTEL